MRRRTLILLALTLISANGLQGQTSRWEVALAGSWMTPNNFNMLEYSAPVVSGEVSLWHCFMDDEWWVARRKNPAFGIRGSLAIAPTGIAGHRIGLVGVIKAPLWRRWDYHIGAGLSTYTRSQYFSHDTENIFISTLLSCLIDVGFDYCATDRLLVSLALLHSSNGMLHRPNKGLNFLQMGLAYNLSGPGYRLQRDTLLPAPPAMKSRHEVGMTLQGGVVESRDLRLDGYYPCYDVSFNYQYYLDPVVAVGGTLDLWYNGSHYRLSRMLGESYTFPCYVSTLGYIEGKWDRVSIKAGIGPVLVAPPRVNIRFYERVGVYYNFGFGRHYVGVSLHAHAGVIEFIEWGYGFRIPV